MKPVTGIGLYELSRCRENGLDVSWKHAFDVTKVSAFGSIVALSFVLLAIFLVWIVVAKIIFRLTFGVTDPASFGSFLDRALTTSEGWTMISPVTPWAVCSPSSS